MSKDIKNQENFTESDFTRFRQILVERRLTHESQFPESEPIIQIPYHNPNYVLEKRDPIIIAEAGNVIGFEGLPKAGKSMHNANILSGLISKNVNTNGFVERDGLEIKPCPLEKTILIIDTEQHPRDSKRKVLDTALEKANLEECPENLHYYNLRGSSVRDYSILLEMIKRGEFGELYCIIFDGGADMVESVLTEDQCNLLVSKFLSMALQYNCLLITVVHLNPNGEKMRGHLGTELLRKAEAVFHAEKDESNHEFFLVFKNLRNAGNTPKLRFRYEDNSLVFVGGDYTSSETQSKKRKSKHLSIDEMREFVSKNLSDGDMSKNDLADFGKEFFNLSGRDANGLFIKRLEMGSLIEIYKHRVNEKWVRLGADFEL